MSPKRPDTADDRRDRRKTPTSGVRVSPEEQDWDDITGQYEGEELERLRAERPSHIRIAHLEAKLDVVTQTRSEQLNQINKGIHQINTRLNATVERTVRAEAAGQASWDAVKNLGPQLEQIIKIGTEVAQTNRTLEKVMTRLDVSDQRFLAVEKAQAEAAVRAEEKEKRERAISAKVEAIRVDVDELKQHRVTADATAKVEKYVAKNRMRAWWFSAKGVGTVLSALAAAIVTVVVAAQKGCLGSEAATPPPAFGSSQLELGAGPGQVQPVDDAAKPRTK